MSSERKIVEETNLLCAFCNKPRTGKMIGEFHYSMGSEWTGIYDERIAVEIYCENCDKLLYKKNVREYE